MNILSIAEQCLRDEAEAIQGLISQMNEDFEKAVGMLLSCKGHVIVSGVGKSGHVGAKIAATLSSTGTPAFYINPLDALHGDLGMITKNDIALLISNSGNSDDLLRMVSFLEDEKVPIVSMTSNPESLLARHSNYHISVAVDHEACPLNLAPTSSTTAALAMGDAIACVLMELRQFKSKDFAKFHPAGSLGKKLVTRVKDVMYTENLPIIPPDMKLSDAIIQISRGQIGTGVVMQGEKILGIVTDGDIRRAVERNRDNFFNVVVSEIMTENPKTVCPEAKLSQIQNIFLKYMIHTLLVVDKEGHLKGIVEYFSIMN